VHRSKALGLPLWLNEALLRLDLQEPVWLVGGAVRDLLLQRKSRDYDFVVVSDGLVKSRKLADILGAAYYPLDESRDIGRVVYRDAGEEWHLDIASLRGKDLDEDLISRDFTVNAMAVDVFGDHTIIDPTGGRQDLVDGVLQACSSTSLTSDPVRLLRSVRIATELEIRLHPDLLADVKNNLHLLRKVSPERIRDEFFNILSLQNSVRVFLLLQHTGLLNTLSEILCEGFYTGHVSRSDTVDWNVFFRLLESFSSLSAIIRNPDSDRINADVVSALLYNNIKPFRFELAGYLDEILASGRSREELMKVYLLLITLYGIGDSGFLSDNGEQQGWIEHCGKLLRLSNSEIAFLLRVRPPEFPEAVEGDGALHAYRFFQERRSAGVASLLLGFIRIWLEGLQSIREAWEERGQIILRYMDYYYNSPERMNPVCLLDGTDVIRITGVKSGPEIGRLLDLLMEAQVEGIVSTPKEAREFIKSTSNKPDIQQIEDFDNK